MGKGSDVQWSRPRRGSQENWLRIKAESLGQCLWLDPVKELRGREVGLAASNLLALCFWVEGGVTSVEQAIKDTVEKLSPDLVPDLVTSKEHRRIRKSKARGLRCG